MYDKGTSREHKKRIDAVIDYILKNLSNDISLQTLAGVANYSPFHLQKLFKQLVGESPKQYIIKLRLETALHSMIIHPYKSISEISIDCGFSSPAIFSRAVKNYFGLSPEEMRMLSPKDRLAVFKHGKHTPPPQANFHLEDPVKKVNIRVKRIEKITGFYLIAQFDDIVEIQQSFKEIIRIADVNDLLIDQTKIYGILSPHQGNIYKTFIATDKYQTPPDRLRVAEIKGGKYASFKIKGGKKETINAGRFFFHDWLPESGYRIADVTWFEQFSKNPATTSYDKLEREVYIGIEPV